MNDKIKPDYYRKNGLDVIDFCHMLDLDFLQGNVVKYTVRYRAKGGIEDLRKAQEYLRRLIEYENGGEEIEVQEEDDFERIAYQRGFVRSEYAHLGDPHFEQVMKEILQLAEWSGCLSKEGLVAEMKAIALNQGLPFRESKNEILLYIKERVLAVADGLKKSQKMDVPFVSAHRIEEELRDIFGENKTEKEEVLPTENSVSVEHWKAIVKQVASQVERLKNDIDKGRENGGIHALSYRVSEELGKILKNAENFI